MDPKCICGRVGKGAGRARLARHPDLQVPQTGGCSGKHWKHSEPWCSWKSTSRAPCGKGSCGMECPQTLPAWDGYPHQIDQRSANCATSWRRRSHRRRSGGLRPPRGRRTAGIRSRCRQSTRVLGPVWRVALWEVQARRPRPWACLAWKLGRRFRRQDPGRGKCRSI